MLVGFDYKSGTINRRCSQIYVFNRSEEHRFVLFQSYPTWLCSLQSFQGWIKEPKWYSIKISINHIKLPNFQIPPWFFVFVVHVVISLAEGVGIEPTGPCFRPTDLANRHSASQSLTPFYMHISVKHLI